ncbi:MAG: chorismate synthase [Lachnospiraceae bacterium]|nr:chorismate synthase [Lachnospiraceae bacterium]
MSNYFGNRIKIDIFGQSHSKAIGVTIEGLPAGIDIDEDKLREFLKRRAPGRDQLTTGRKEADEYEIICGMADGKTCGAPLTALIYNKDQHSKDYSNIKDMPRPGHADYTAAVKYDGYNDIAGGGKFSGRLTAPMCIAGGIIMQLLEKEGIRITSHIYSIKDIKDTPYDLNGPFTDVSNRELPVLDKEVIEPMKAAVLEAKNRLDSVGGIIECAITGLRAGIGEPMFDGIENLISRTVFAIPAVKGIEFGRGFEAAGIYGSENNDEFCLSEGQIVTKTNNHGGILGGITSGMPIVFRAAFKPTPSIARPQQSVSLSKMQEGTLEIKGRHDPCIVLRALPCVESAAAIALYDAMT